MLEKLSKKQLIKEINRLNTILQGEVEFEKRLNEAKRELFLLQKEISALQKSLKSILEQSGFKECARTIFDHCKDLIGASSGYVALLSSSGEENEVLFLESGGLPCTVNPDLPMPIRGLRAESYRLNQTVYNNDFMNSPWVKFMPKGHVILENVMFAPLIIQGRTVGIMGLANKPGDFDEKDARLASGFGELAAIALQNSRNLDKRKEAEIQKEGTIGELKKALNEVKKLSGLLPICSYCKKIRDDKGYWNRIDAYIQEHSEARFSHGICQDCLKLHHPEIKKDDNH